MHHTAYISVGSNLGDKLRYCREGIAELTRSNRIALQSQSPFYKTEPVDYTDQDWFVNAVLKIDTVWTPVELLEVLEGIERRAGRIRDAVRFGPRVLDLDIIFYDQRVIDSQRLKVPHPRMHKRRFVLQPICDIDPDIVHPVLQQTVSDLLAQLDASHQRLELIQ